MFLNKGAYFSNMNFKSRMTILEKIFSQRIYFMLFLLFSVIMGGLLSFLTDLPLIQGNYGQLYANTTVVVIVLIAVLFGINITALIYKISESNKLHIKATTSTTIGSFLAILVAGCSVCGFSFAYILGLGSVVAVLPFAGLELKIIAIILLVYSNYTILTQPQCKLKTQEKSKHSKTR